MEHSVGSSNKGMLKRNEGIVDYWLSKQFAYPTLSKIAFRIIPVSSLSTLSKSDFSLLKLAISKYRCNSKNDIIDTL